MLKKLLLSRFTKFCAVGGSGVVVNATLFRLLTIHFGLYYRIASILAIEIAIVNNFIWNYLWTFRDRKPANLKQRAGVFLRFNMTSGLTAMAVNWGLLVLLTEAFGMGRFRSTLWGCEIRGEEIANIIGIASGTISNYLLSRSWAFTSSLAQKQE